MCASVFAQAKTDTRCPHWKDPRYLRGAYIMNHKKLLLTLTLCLCALLCMVVTASASEVQGHTNHFSCGVAGCQNNDHGHTQVTEWQPWTGPQSASEDNIPYDSNTKTAYIYLANNVEIEDALTIPKDHTLYLCLNGKTISYRGAGIYASGLIYIAGGGALTICDCQNTGCIKYEKAQSSDQISTIHSWGTLNLYGGTISRMNTNNSGHAIRTRSTSKFNMYGGTVSNDGATPALYLENATNIYGGVITCTNGIGIDTAGEGNNYIDLLIAGGTISAGKKEAIDLSATVLTLSGQPTITSAGTDSAVIDAGANIIKIADSFAPAHCISVSKSGDNDTFAEPVEGGASLADKAQYFTSFESGKFVAYDNGTLKFTACAITQQPTKDNSYTVKGNAPDSKLSYRWYAAKKGEITVTDAVAKKSADARYSNAWNEWQVKCGNEIDCFTLYMNKGDVLTLSGITGGRVTEVLISGSKAEKQDSWTYIFTAPATGEYTLKISAMGFNMDDSNVPDRSDLSFEAALRTLVPDTTKPMGGTTAVLATTGLSAGDYICQVTWEGKSTVNSGVVQFSGSSQQPTGSGSYYYAPSAAEDKKDSPKTADPGVLLYAGLALASLTGLACTAKKRH